MGENGKGKTTHTPHAVVVSLCGFDGMETGPKEVLNELLTCEKLREPKKKNQDERGRALSTGQTSGTQCCILKWIK